MLLRTLTILSFAAAVYAVPIAGTGGAYPVFDSSLSIPSTAQATSDFPTAPAAPPITTTIPDVAPVTVLPEPASAANGSPTFDLATAPADPDSVTPPTHMNSVAGQPDDIDKIEQMLDDIFAKSEIPVEQPSVQSANLPEIAPPCDTTTDPTGNLSNPPIPVPAVQPPVDAAPCNKCKNSNTPLSDFASTNPAPPSPPSASDLTSGVPSLPALPFQDSAFPMFPDTQQANQQGTGNGQCNTGADCGFGNCCSEFGNCGNTKEYCNARSKPASPLTANAEAPCPVDPTLSDVSSGNTPPLPSFNNPISSPSFPPVLPATLSCPCANNSPTSFAGTPVSNAFDPSFPSSFPTSFPSTSPVNSANTVPNSPPASLPSNDPFSFSSTAVPNPDSLQLPSLDDLTGKDPTPSTLPAMTPNNPSANPADCDTTQPANLNSSTSPTSSTTNSPPPAVGNLSNPAPPPTTGNAMSSNYQKPAY